MGQIPLFQVDSFTDQPFKGNPAGVCLLSEKHPEEWMRAVAAEMNLSETAFVMKHGEDFDLRWFTPAVEIELCGHATLASAHILWEKGIVPKGQEIRFQTKSGILTIKKDREWIEMNFPARSIREVAENEGVVDALGANPDEVFQSGENLLLVFNDERTIREMKPNFSSLKTYEYHGYIVTAPASGPGFDFISRFFAPAIGVDEDPVTGSSHCTLAPYWQEKLRKDSMTACQVSKRGGVLKVRVSGERVYISGQAVTVFSTTLRDYAPYADS